MAAELWETVGQIELAVQSYVDGGLWERARACVSSMKSSENSKRLLYFVEKSYKYYLKKENKAEELFQ